MTISAHRFTRTIPGLLALILFLSAPALGSDKDKYKVALLPLVFHADQTKAYLRAGFKSMFLSRLSGEGIEVIRDNALLPLLTEGEKMGISSRDRAEGLADALGADFVIFGSVTAMGEAYSFAATLKSYLLNDKSTSSFKCVSVICSIPTAAPSCWCCIVGGGFSLSIASKIASL